MSTRYLRNNSFFLYIIGILAVAALGLYFRFLPLYTHVDSGSYEKATMLTLAQLRSLAKKRIESQYPNLSSAKKEQLARLSLNKILHEESSKTKATIDKIAKEIAAVNKTPSSTYLLASDSYNYFQLTENIVKTGRISPKIVGSKYFNPLMMAPLGYLEPLSLHPYVGVLVYRTFRLFNPKVALIYAVSFTPLVIALLSLIPFLGICRLLKYSRISTVLAALLFFCSPFFLKRSAFGWYDNDPYNVFFPLIVLWILFYAFKEHAHRKRCFVLSLAGAFAMALYAFFWQGWVFLFGVLLASGFFLLFYYSLFVKNHTYRKQAEILLAVFALGVLGFISFSFGLSDFFRLFKEGFDALKNFTTPQISAWPNLYISVGELRRLGILETLRLNGSLLFFVIALAGFGMGVNHLRFKDRPFLNIASSTVLCVFFAACLAITLKAQRFALLFLVPLSLLFPLGLEYLYNQSRAVIKKIPWENKIRQILLWGLILLIIGFMALTTLRTDYMQLREWRPLFNQTWEKTLLAIKAETPKNSIINTWWPPGHFIKAIAGRRVTFDGATINKPQAYWMARVFLSRNEKEAAGFLRMLNNGGNEATEYLQQIGFPLSRIINLLDKVMQLNAVRAKNMLLATGLSAKQTDTLLSITHKVPPPSYLLVYNELVEKNIQFKFIGGWDFKKIEELNKNKSELHSVLKKNFPEFIQYLWAISGGPFKYSGILDEIGQKNNNLIFEEGVRIGLNDMSCRVDSKKYGKGIPQSLFFEKHGRIKEKLLDGATLSFSALLYREDNRYYCLLLDRALADSLLMKLYFYKASGLRYFHPIIEESNLTKRTRIYIFRVDWQKFLADLKLP